MSNAPTERIEVDFEIEEHCAHYRAFDLSAAAAQLLGYSCDVYGWSLKNLSSSAVATIDIYDSADGTGIPVFPIVIAANGVSAEWFGPNGVRFNNAVYANVTAGEIKGSILFRHVRH